MWRNKFWEWWEQYGAYVVGPSLVFAGFMVGKYIEPLCPSRFVSELTVALFIAGILTVTVDPFVKRRARREATRDIFHHMLGYSLPEVIRERLQNIVENTKFYRKNTTVYINLSEERELLVFDVQMEFEVVNPTSHALSFEPLLQFERGELADLKSVTCFEEPEWGKDVKLEKAKNAPGAVEYRGKGITVSAQGSRRLKYEYAIKYPTSLGFFYPNFQYPTIGLSLTIKAPSNFTVRATAAEFESPGEWRYTNKLFMPQEHLGIVWEKIAS